MKNDRTEFISALDAVHLLSAHLGGDKLAKRAIIERLMDGAIRSTCWWWAHGIDYTRQLTVSFDAEECGELG